MCVAIAQKQGAPTLTDEQVMAGWLSNDDGGGYAFIHPDGHIQEYHSMDFDDFLEKYKKDHQDFGDASPFLVHMRIATHGTVKLENTHPFRYHTQQGETVVIHNGIIHGMSHLTNENTTDTQAFITNVLQYFDDEWMDNPEIVDMVDYSIGWSKLAILTTSPLVENNLYIINENAKEAYWYNDSWFSNSSCEWGQGWATPTTTEACAIPAATTVDPYVWDEVDAWLADNEDHLFLFTREQRANATGDEWHKMVIEAITKGAVCTHCMGKVDCYCNDLCYLCFAPWYDCECSGAWQSIEHFRYSLDKPGVDDDDLVNIANAHLEKIERE